MLPDHQETGAIAGYIVMLMTAGLCVVGVFKKKACGAGPKSVLQANWNNKHLALVAIEKGSPVGRPLRLAAAGGRNLDLATETGVLLYEDLPLPALVRNVGEPAAIR